MLAWPDVVGSHELISKLVDVSIRPCMVLVMCNVMLYVYVSIIQDICNGAMFYAHVTHQKLQEAGYYDEEGQFYVTDQVNSQSLSLWGT